MKKFLSLALTLMVMLTATLISACKKEPLVIKDGDTFVLIKVETDKTNLTLAKYMEGLEEYKDMFVIENGMVVSINGIENASDWSACWMLYTNDYSEDCSNAGWGTLEYEGETYNSAAWGAEKLIVKNGCNYIWYIKRFNENR